MGVVPEGMDHRWLACFDGEAFCFHRSWTGSSIWDLHVILKWGMQEMPKRKQRLQEPGAFPRHFLSKEADWGRFPRLFFDEAGQQDMSEGYYLLTLVLHDQAVNLGPYIEDYEKHLSVGKWPDVPFHMVALLHGHGDYEGMDVHERRGLLARLNAFVRTLSVRYHTFVYSSFDVGTKDDLVARMRRDIVEFIYTNLDEFLSPETIAVYYDDGRRAFTKAVHDAFGYMFGGVTVSYKQHGCQDRRLAQVADYLCSIELAAMRYERGEESSTYHKFFGTRGDFKRNYLKQVRRKLP